MTTPKPVTKGYSRLLNVSAAMTCLLVIMGGVVCITGSGAGCPDWPACYGNLLPPLVVESVIEYTHRFVAILTTPLIIVSAVLGWRRYREERWISRPLLAAVVLTFAVIIFGALVVLRGLPLWAGMTDLGSALLALAMMVTAAVIAAALVEDPAVTGKMDFNRPLARLALWAAALTYLTLLSGIPAAEPGSIERCFGFPMFTGIIFPENVQEWLQLARRILAIAAGILMLAAAIGVLRTRRASRRMTRTASWLIAVFLLEVLVSIFAPLLDTPFLLRIAYSAAAGVTWALLVVLAVQTGLPPEPADR